MEVELARLREENAELKRKVAETSSLETAKRKAESKVEALEGKVWILVFVVSLLTHKPPRWKK